MKINKINHLPNLEKVPHDDISSAYETYIITDNKTMSDGSVINAHEENANYARKWVDENHK